MYVFDTGVLSNTCVAGSGVSRVALGKIERGDVFPRAETLDVLANALDVSVGAIVAPARPLRSVRFRARTRAHARERILAELSKWLDACYGLEAELECAWYVRRSKKNASPKGALTRYWALAERR